ncbi:sterile alpha motif domain-containing protein 9-like [Littorina saxatilis]|uniref:sterile alpha motif domain-containing protein 9-like n=1 Tax=Littorina saxatilis TaxID=31220 RepID=UPI0038B48AC5
MHTEFESLMEDIDLNYGLARKIIFLRDNRPCQSKMLQWNMDEVISFVRRTLNKSDLDLPLFEQKGIDGVVFLSFTDAGELKRDLGLSGLHARRVFEERNEFLKNETNGMLSLEQTSFAVDMVAGDIKVSALAKEVSQTKTPWLYVHDSHQTYKKKVLTEVLTGRPGDLKKIFLQDTLHLQHLSVPKDLKDKSFKNVSLKILQIAEQNPSVLDQNFGFCIACGSDLTKDSFRLLWNSIKTHVHLWLELVPVHLKGQLKIENDKVIHNGNVVAFSKIPTPSQVNIGDVDRKGIKLCSSDCTWILLVDRHILTENVPGYVCNVGTHKNVLKYMFGFDKARKYYVFDVASSTCTFESAQLKNTQAGLLERCFLQLKDGAAASAETPQTCNTDKKNEHSKQDNMPKESNPNEVLASAAPKSARPRKRLTLVPPRKFKQDPKTCKYLKGQLDIHETADGFILPSTELKHYEREDTPLKEKFLLKSLKFICGCMNSRRNGTIYFGVPEGDTQDQEFEYAEIVGVSLEEHERNEYYECFHRFLEKCFLKKSKVVKECVYGPYFVRIKTQQTESERFVIEVDVEPAADTCVENYFEFDPGHINKNLKEEKGVYLRGIEGGTVQTKILPSDATEKYKEDLPAIVKKRKEEEKKREGYMETRTNDAAKRLTAFMKECDESVDPVLLISKPTENVKADMDACLKFVKRIPWVAVLDFDYQSSEENGLLHLQTSSPSIKNVLPIPVKTFEKKKVEKQKVELNMSLQTLWFLANGSSGEGAFDHLEHNDWLKQYYPFVRNAVVFLQNSCVISKQRHHILILVSAEMEEDIIKTADDMASDPSIGLDSAFFVFDEERTQELFISKSMFGEDIKTRSCTMPWQDVQRIVNAVLQLDRKHDHKQVITAGDTPAEIPPHQWLKWTDLSILTANECEEVDPTLEHSKAEDEEFKFYKGGEVSWLNFHFPNHVMPRSNMEKIEEKILTLAYKDCTDTPTVIIHHMPGTGGTTLAKHLLWKRRKSFKCAVIDRMSHNTFSQVCEFWESEEILDRLMWKPLLLVSDNHTTDESDISNSELCDKIYKHQKRAGLSKPMAILIICHRTAVHVRHGITGYSLKQQLIDEKERLWMEDTYRRLEGEKVPSDLNSFLGFLCLRHEFKQKKLEEIITPYLYDETLSEKERELIIYIALIVKYFPPSLGRPGIPVSSCDMFMNHMKHTWDKKVLGIANVILVREYNHEIKKRVVKIANRLVAEVILSVVMQRDSRKLPDLVIDCLNSSLVADLDECELNNSSWTIKILRNMLIDRLTETGTKRHMSPLILEVQKDSLDKAVEILELGYQQLGGEVFYQQLARLYTKEVLFEKAVTCAQKAVDLSRTDNEEFAHTLGFVYLRYFEHLTRSKETASYKVACHKNELEKAIKSFNSLTNAQNSADAITKSYACCDKMKMINSLLHYIINKVLPPKDYGKFGRFLVAEGYDMDNFDEYSDLKHILKEILETGTEALKYMYYFGFSYKHRMEFAIRNRSKFPVSYTKGECVRQFKTLARTIAIVVTAPMPDDELPMSVQLKRFRVENLKLTGSFFESQLDFVAGFHHAKPPKPKQKQQQCCEQLKKIKANLDEILTGSYTPEDMDNYITVCLAMEMLGIEQEFTQKRSEIYDFCNRIISSGDGEARTMRAHLYRMLVCWPTWKKSEVFSTYQFLQSFNNRPTFLTCREGPLTPRAHFFIASSKSKFHVCHWTEIFERKKTARVHHYPLEDMDEEDGEEEEHDTEEIVNVAMHQKLQSFRGIHKVSADGAKGTVELNMALYSRKLPETVTIRAVKAGKKVCVDAEVEFFLGFSLQGPVAYVHNLTPLEPHR